MAGGTKAAAKTFPIMLVCLAMVVYSLNKAQDLSRGTAFSGSTLWTFLHPHMFLLVFAVLPHKQTSPPSGILISSRSLSICLWQQWVCRWLLNFKLLLFNKNGRGKKRLNVFANISINRHKWTIKANSTCVCKMKLILSQTKMRLFHFGSLLQ